MDLSIIILAAGEGKRMRSSLPKVLHRLAGKPLLAHVYETANVLAHKNIHIVYGKGGTQLQEALPQLQACWVHQTEQLGTGHAVMQAIPNIPESHQVLVLYGDTPLISQATLGQLLDSHHPDGLNILTAELKDPTGYGRIVRNKEGTISHIVEEKDTDEATNQITEINTGILLAPASLLKTCLGDLRRDNAQGEYYLTDLAAICGTKHVPIHTFAVGSAIEIYGVNTRYQLAELERHYQFRQAKDFMLDGLGFADPHRFDLRGQLSFGNDNEIDINVIMEGKVTLEDHVTIGPNCWIKNAQISSNTKILANCVIEDTSIGESCIVGPFARIRPETKLKNKVHIGNFVEIKKSQIDHNTKINHLSYIGDSEIGHETNIGAGTITCNYDGAKKHKTEIGNRVFVGSDVQLVAPVKIGNDATIAAGTTVTNEVAANTLAIGRAKQEIKINWQRPK